MLDLIFGKAFDELYDKFKGLLKEKITDKRKLDDLRKRLGEYHVEFCEEYSFAQTSSFQNFVEYNLNISGQYLSVQGINPDYKTVAEIQEKIVSDCIQRFRSTVPAMHVKHYFRKVFEMINKTLYDIAQDSPPIVISEIGKRITESTKEVVSAISTRQIVKSPESQNNVGGDPHTVALMTARQFRDEIDKPLFLEGDNEDGKIVTLRELYIEPSFVFTIDKGRKIHTDIGKLFEAFANDNMKDYLHGKGVSIENNNIKGLFIIGQPGIGKSSLSIRIATDYLETEILKRNVFFIRFRELDGTLELMEGICKYLNLRESDYQNSVIFLDGFDELAIASKDVEDYFNTFSDKVDCITNCHFVVTSRTNYVPNRLIYSIYTELKLYDIHRVKEFIRKYSLIHRNIDEDIVNDIVSSENALFRIPLIIYLVLAKKVRISKTRNKGELYDALFKADGYKNLRGEEKKREYIKYHYKLSKIPQLIAYEMYKANALYIGDSIIEEHISRGENDETTRKILLRMYGVDNYYKINLGYVEFINTSLFDYFAAKKIFNDIKAIILNPNTYDEPAIDCLQELEDILVRSTLKTEIMDFITNFCENDSEDLNSHFSIEGNCNKLNNLLERLIESGMCVQPRKSGEAFFEKAHNMFLILYRIFHTLLVAYRSKNNLIKFKENTIRNILYLNMNKPELSLRCVDLKNADLGRVNLVGADLRGAEFNAESNLCGAIIEKQNPTKISLQHMKVFLSNAFIYGRIKECCTIYLEDGKQIASVKSIEQEYLSWLEKSSNVRAQQDKRAYINSW